MSQYNSGSSGTIVRAESALNGFLRGVYAWMTAGLAVTAGVAWYTAHSPFLLQLIFGGSFGFIVLIVAQLGMVIALSAAIHKMSAGMATCMFLLYSALSGLTLSLFLLVYPSDVFIKAFATASGTFAAFSLYGLLTKRDLTGIGSFMTVGLIGIIIASLINWFTKSPALDYAICVIGVIVFLGLTAHDTQKLRLMGENAPMDDTLAVHRGTIMGALTLYLDFINLFIFLLRIFGNRR
ncbi:MAG: Bax inhibitor-1/YccA family protein [Desulfovibrionaceae bacterium]|nr:Bax inhibitor-1/YccA family protein [Desulfovibrionaceae bacterium]